MKCAYLGCKKEGEVLDDVETSPGATQRKMVCKGHEGMLVKHITILSKSNLPYMFSTESGEEKV